MDGFDFGDLLDEAFERAGLDPASISHRHLNSARRSLLLLNTIIENEGGGRATAEYREDTVVIPLPTGRGAVTLPDDTIDVMACQLLFPNSLPLPLARTTREDYFTLARPTHLGSPSLFWVSKSLPGELTLFEPTLVSGWGAAAFSQAAGGNVTSLAGKKVLVLWPQNGLSGVSVQVTRLRDIAMPVGMGDAIDARRNWWETYCQGLAAQLAAKWNQPAAGPLEAKFMRTLRSRFQDENHGPVQVGFRAFGWSRPRRH